MDATPASLGVCLGRRAPRPPVSGWADGRRGAGLRARRRAHSPYGVEGGRDYGGPGKSLYVAAGAAR